MQTKRKLCVVTGSRADYGLLRLLMKQIQLTKNLELQLIVTGSHLSKEHGHTVDAIAQDGFTISAQVPAFPRADTELAVSQSIGEGVTGLATALHRLAPDVLVILGDRTEILAAAVAALPLRIPIAHLHGGEITEGAIDEQARHAITKLSHLHFASTEEHRRRIIQLGEQAERVWNVGAIGLDARHERSLVPREQLLRQLPFRVRGPLLLSTLHSITLHPEESSQAAKAMLAAFDQLPDASVVFTGSNADAGGKSIQAEIDRWVKENSGRTHQFTTLGTNYWSWMNAADAMVGNSSSGLIEAPSVGLPAVNIGTRQKGRLRGPSVIDVQADAEAVLDGLHKALNPGLRDELRRAPNPYGDGKTAPQIADVLAKADLTNILIKKFVDRN